MFCINEFLHFLSTKSVSVNNIEKFYKLPQSCGLLFWCSFLPLVWFCSSVHRAFPQKTKTVILKQTQLQFFLSSPEFRWALRVAKWIKPSVKMTSEEIKPADINALLGAIWWDGLLRSPPKDKNVSEGSDKMSVFSLKRLDNIYTNIQHAYTLVFLPHTGLSTKFCPLSRTRKLSTTTIKTWPEESVFKLHECRGSTDWDPFTIPTSVQSCRSCTEGRRQGGKNGQQKNTPRLRRLYPQRSLKTVEYVS